MDFTSLVKKKLQAEEECICSLLAVQLPRNDSRKPTVAALVEHKEEHGLFLYHCIQVPASKTEHLLLDVAIPINQDFKYSIASQAAGTQQGSGSLPIRIQSGSTSVFIELPNRDQANHFLSELKTQVQVFSQNAGFGITSRFVWIDQYTRGGMVEPENPFANDIFDPLSAKDGWPFSQILQANVGKDCPVVKDDNPMQHSVSAPDMSSVNMSDSGSYHSGLNVGQSDLEHSLQRSYDRSMDNLDQLGAAVTGETVVNSRDMLIKHLMKQREEQYMDIQTYRLFCGTWNTNGQSASSPIKAWLSPQEDDIPPDLYAIGFQELDLSKNAFIFSESPKEEEWYNRVKNALHHKAKYKKVKLIRLVGMMLVVFVRIDLAKHVYDVMWDTVGTGILGMMGNKGGVGVRLYFHDSTIAFVNTHLAAHMDEYERRNQDFRDISSRMIFGKTKEKGEFTIGDHDMVFWIGDLNYRLSDIDNDRTKKLIDERRLTDLMNYDQLCRQISLKKVFLDYVEGRVNFVPTYKYDPGTDNWDTSEKCRTPAWCDRILWRGRNVRQLKYRSHMECRISDHKPVSAIFDVGIKVINRKQYRMVYEDIMKQLDSVENEFLPQVVLDRTDVQFKDVKFVELQTNIVTVTNTGQGPVQFEFINKPQEVTYCKKWLLVEPSKGIIDVGQRYEIRLDVYVESPTAAKLNIGQDKIEDILVLHLVGGKDLFITVGGNYIPSCFGTSLENLVNMFAPMRQVPQEQVAQLARRGEVSSDRPLDIPKEIYWLVDHLFKYGINQEDLFQHPGRHSEIQEVRDCLDQGALEGFAGQVHSAAEALLVFLEALPEPVIPHKVYQKCLESCGNFAACKQVLTQIPVCHRNVFKYLCAFLREFLRRATPSSLDQTSVARLFSGLLLRSPPPPAGKAGANIDDKKSAVGGRDDENRRSSFLTHFLVNEYDG